ncbi:MAG: type II secretion system protein [Methylophilus sp.]|uniref:type II secretion system protein n=1 Tax=Methylophilus sp. TaxID=29541 RepID=UPI003F9F67B4
MRLINEQYRSLLRAPRGFSYIGVMVTLVIAAIGMQGAAVMWQQQTQRANEALLLEVGEAYRLAIGRYYESTPQPVKQYPLTLSELTEDKRFPVLKRHLRRVYADPFATKQGMVTIVRDGRIIGVHSQSLQVPIRSTGYQEFQSSFKSAKHYRDWQFIYEPNTLADLEEAWSKR